MSDKTARTRISLTLTKPYVDALDQLVDEGLYMEHQDAVRDALRHLFQLHGIETFSDKGAEPEAAAPSEP